MNLLQEADTLNLPPIKDSQISKSE